MKMVIYIYFFYSIIIGIYIIPIMWGRLVSYSKYATTIHLYRTSYLCSPLFCLYPLLHRSSITFSAALFLKSIHSHVHRLCGPTFRPIQDVSDLIVDFVPKSLRQTGCKGTGITTITIPNVMPKEG